MPSAIELITTVAMIVLAICAILMVYRTYFPPPPPPPPELRALVNRVEVLEREGRRLAAQVAGLSPPSSNTANGT